MVGNVGVMGWWDRVTPCPAPSPLSRRQSIYVTNNTGVHKGMQKCVPFCVLGRIFTKKLGLLGPGRGLFKKNKQKEQNFLWKNKKEFVSLPQIKNI